MFSGHLPKALTAPLTIPFTAPYNPSHSPFPSPSHRPSYNPSHSLSHSPSHNPSYSPSHRVPSHSPCTSPHTCKGDLDRAHDGGDHHAAEGSALCHRLWIATEDQNRHQQSTTPKAQQTCGSQTWRGSEAHGLTTQQNRPQTDTGNSTMALTATGDRRKADDGLAASALVAVRPPTLPSFAVPSGRYAHRLAPCWTLLPLHQMH